MITYIIFGIVILGLAYMISAFIVPVTIVLLVIWFFYLMGMI